MFAGLTFVPVLIVSSDARHQLLSFDAFLLWGLLFEVFSFISSERRGQTATMKDFNIAVLSDSVGETKIVGWGLFLHFKAGGDAWKVGGEA
jgi:hypothetical protein